VVFTNSYGRLATHIPVGDDARLALCMLQWDVDAWRQGRSWHDLWQLPCLYPEPNMLANSDPLLGGAVLYAPLHCLTGQPILAFNLWIIVLVALNFLAAYGVARRLLAAALPALYVAILFAIPCVRLGHADHWHLWPQFPTPLIFLAAVRLAEGRGGAWAMVGGVNLAVQFYLSMYLGYMAALMLGILLATLACTDPRRFRDGRFLARLLVAAASAGFLLMPLVGPYRAAVERWGGWIWEGTLGRAPRWTNFITGYAGEQTAYCGRLAVGLFGVGLAILLVRILRRRDRPPFWLLGAGVGATLLACISVNLWDSYYALYQFLPGFSALRCPARLTLLTVWLGTLVGGWLLVQVHRRIAFWNRAAAGLAGLVVLGMVVQENYHPLAWSDVRLADEDFYRTVVRSLPAGSVADFPLNQAATPPTNTVLGMRLQGAAAAGWRPSFNVFTGREPDWLLPLIKRLSKLTSPKLAAGLIGELRLRRIRYVVVHKDEVSARQLRAWQRACDVDSGPRARAIYEDNRHLVMDLSETACEAQMCARFGAHMLRPRVPLLPGRYRAICDVQTTGAAGGCCEVHRRRPEAGPFPVLLARVEVTGMQERRPVTLEFMVPVEPGPEPLIEFRAVPHGAGDLYLREVVVVPVSN
jgi:hypothetical protein